MQSLILGKGQLIEARVCREKKALKDEELEALAISEAVLF